MHVEGVLDVSTAPSAGECKTKRVETAGVWAKEITQAVAFMSLHRSACYSALLSLCFFACVNVVKGWETGLADWRLSTSLAPLNLRLAQGSFPGVLSLHASAVPSVILFRTVYTFLRGGRGGCSGALPERGVCNADFD